MAVAKALWLYEVLEISQNTRAVFNKLSTSTYDDHQLPQ